ncbi:thioredoxin-like protein [Halteromyces radiatus]|uniref:thioredoxin-like protein n=1 Tax=Halteromyces radiatus TaxID=101107 RepID=UPI00221EAB82|nr:thioredoxin-like protein [Halteromyces radiatus]KAI8093296.1 thioredoxin-like protein [Halteromyces radiatus]
MASSKLTLYRAEICPYAQRAAIALKESGADYNEVLIDLQNKPDWYTVKVNPEGKVPALDVNGTTVAESLVVIELVNDLFPEKNLLPKDPIKKAQARFVIEFFNNKIWTNVFKHAGGQLSKDDFIKESEAGFTRLNELLLEQSKTGPYFLGEQYSLADVAVSPFLARIFALTSLFGGEFQFKAIKDNERLAQFVHGVLSRPSFRESYAGDEAFIDILKNKFNYHL